MSPGPSGGSALIGWGGPVGLLGASVRGDEAPWALVDSLSPDEVSGTLRMMPVANPLAVQAGQCANGLDGLGPNSALPCDATRTHTQRLARALAETGLDGADFVLDVRGSGSSNINCFAYQLRGSADLAAWAWTRLLADAPDRSSSLTGYAAVHGARAVWIEAGGRGEYELARAEYVANGLRHAVRRSGVLTSAHGTHPVPALARAWEAVSTSAVGIYVPALTNAARGSTVTKGTMIGQLLDPESGAIVEEYQVPFSPTTFALIRPTVTVIDSPGNAIPAVAVTAQIGR